MDTIEKLWNEIYDLRRRFIAKNECPNCAGYLLPEEVNGVTGFYRCCECNWVWAYFGGLEAKPED
jgi:hypothetical protein